MPKRFFIGVFQYNTADPMTLSAQVNKLKTRFKLRHVVLVGDRGMITQARIEEVVRPAGFDWIAALRSSVIDSLMQTGFIQMSLFGEQDMASMTSPDYPGERLAACRNANLAQRRATKREELLCATEKDLDKLILRTQKMNDNEVVLSYKRLAQVERVFRTLKTSQLEIRPIYHWNAERVRDHALLCMLAYCVEWHLGRKLAPLLFDETNPEAAETLRENPVVKVKRSPSAKAKERRRRTPDDLPVLSFKGLLKHLATYTWIQAALRSDRRYSFVMYPGFPETITMFFKKIQ